MVARKHLYWCLWWWIEKMDRRQFWLVEFDKWSSIVSRDVIHFFMISILHFVDFFYHSLCYDSDQLLSIMIFLYSIVTFFSWAISTVKSSKLCIIIHNFKVYWFHYNSSYKNRPYVSIDLWHEKLHLLELIGLFFLFLMDNRWNGPQFWWMMILKENVYMYQFDTFSVLL